MHLAVNWSRRFFFVHFLNVYNLQCIFLCWYFIKIHQTLRKWYLLLLFFFNALSLMPTTKPEHNFHLFNRLLSIQIKLRAVYLNLVLFSGRSLFIASKMAYQHLFSWNWLEHSARLLFAYSFKPENIIIVHSLLG